MKKLFLLVFCAIFLQAGFLDFTDVSHAKKSYEKKDYKRAIKDYRKIQSKDGATYDLANSYYKNKNYKKALSTYQKVSDPKLQFKKLHNMGNTYAHLKKIDEAIKSYEDALKIKKDKDTQYNLDLLKKQKKKKKHKNKGSKKKKKKDNNSGKNHKKDQKKKNSQSREKKKTSQNNRGEKQKQNKNKDKQQKNKKSQEKKNMTQKKKKVQPISNMEERKYKKMLNQRGINTLMLPLSTKGEKRNEENPW